MTFLSSFVEFNLVKLMSISFKVRSKHDFISLNLGRFISLDFEAEELFSRGVFDW